MCDEYTIIWFWLWKVVIQYQIKSQKHLNGTGNCNAFVFSFFYCSGFNCTNKKEIWQDRITFLKLLTICTPVWKRVCCHVLGRRCLQKIKRIYLSSEPPTCFWLKLILWNKSIPWWPPTHEEEKHFLALLISESGTHLFGSLFIMSLIWRHLEMI